MVYTLQLGTYLGCPRYPGILSIQGSQMVYTLQLGTYLGCPRYPGILSIQGSGYIPCNLGRTWDVPGIPGYLVFRDLRWYIPCNLGRTWDVPGIPGYLVFRDLGIYLANGTYLGYPRYPGILTQSQYAGALYTHVVSKYLVTLAHVALLSTRVQLPSDTI